MKAICIFLGSKPGNHPAYMEVAATLGKEIALRGLTCIYGGSRTGLMSALADNVLAAGGKIVGVTVEALRRKENFHRGLSELHILPTMHERKNLMVQLSDAFIALPGGIGTLEEFFEVYTLAQMGFHNKPCGLLNVNGFYTPLEQMMAKTEQEGFLKNPYRKSIIRANDPVTMLDCIIEAAGKN